MSHSPPAPEACSPSRPQKRSGLTKPGNAALLVLALAALRGLLLWGADPLLAVANNYDMIRVQGCIDAYPARPAEIPPARNSPEAPLERYRFQHVPGARCSVTSEAVFAVLARPLMWTESRLSADGTFSIRWVGAVKLAVLIGLAAAFTAAWLRRGQERAALLNALMVLLVLSDPANLLYLNGFYAELAAVILAYAAIAGTALAVGSRSSTLLPGLVALAILALCLSKVQHAAAGLALAGGLLLVRIMGIKIPKSFIIAVLTAGGVGLAVQVAQIQRDGLATMRLANMTNVVFTAVLPLSPRPADLVDALGLPPRCAEYVGLSWWVPPVSEHADRHPCREVAAVPHTRLLTLMVHQPRTMLRFFAGGLTHLRPWLGNRKPHGGIYLGLVGGRVRADLPPGWLTWSRALDRLSRPQFALFVLGPIPLVLVVLSRLRRRADGAPLAAVLAMLLCLAGSTYFSILLGNGYMDVAKVSNLMTNALLAIWLLSSCVAAALLVRRLREIVSRKPMGTEQHESANRIVMRDRGTTCDENGYRQAAAKQQKQLKAPRTNPTVVRFGDACKIAER